ncbi:MAG TPA: DsbC family protein [Rhodocyclaceae bacterium]|nr:DsbC family protein [Rhodocyclaceae bacterium]
MYRKLLTLILGASFAFTAAANEADIRKAIESKLGAKVESVNKAGYLGLYEVYLDGQILYTDEKVSAIIIGNLIDPKTMKSVTEERMRKLSAIKFSDLPLERAIKQVRGDGKRTLVTFEDPNCGYCKRLAKEMQKLDNVTIYTFLYPILSEDSVKKSKQIWCSADKAKTWNEWMVDGKAPSGRDDCDTSVLTKNQEYGRKYNITGTPTLFFTDGERIPGAVPLAKIEEKLAQTSK